MKPGAPWSVKGIKPEARETAKSAARRAGMTLGEWLNQTIQETDFETVPEADPMRAPEDWKRETGEELPWTRPIEALSADVKARLAASENENTALLTSLESAIGSISKKLIALDKADHSRGAEPANLEARLVGIETRQERALSKDHLKSLETAVGQISVVMDSQAARNDAARQAQSARIDQSQKALVDLAAHLEQTEDRVNQALSSVEAASELYDITDKQGQMIDSLVMDVAAVQAEQKNAEARTSAKLVTLSGEVGDLRSQVESIADLATGQTATASEDTRLAGEAIAAQISVNEERSAASISQIENQIVGLSELLDQSLRTRQSGIEDLRGAVELILQRVDVLESVASDSSNDPQEDEPEPTESVVEPASTLPAEAATTRTVPDPVTVPVTFKTAPQQSSQSVHVNMAVKIDPDFVRSEPVSTGEDTGDQEPLEIEVAEAPDFDDLANEENIGTIREDIALSEELIEDAPEPALGPQIVEPPVLRAVREDNGANLTAQGEPPIVPSAISETIAREEDIAEWNSEVEAVITDHLQSVEALEDEPLSFKDIFGAPENDPATETLVSTVPFPAAGPSDSDEDEDAALKEAVTNISTMRASWAAKNEAGGKPGSMRQIVEVGDEDAARRGWAMTAGGFIVILGAISAVLVYSGDSSDLIDARERPGLFAQMTSWGQGRTDQSPGAEAPALVAVEDTQLSLILANIPAGLEEAAQGGDARAQFALGRALASGDGRQIDRAAAFNWYEAAAAQGLAIAQYVLASLHERGIDVAEDKKLAMDWYAAAARGGNRRSMHNLAVAYARGDVITQDLTQAAYWFSEAASLGLSDAQYNLALLHERGLGVDQDSLTAMKWYQIAAAGGDQSALAQARRLGEKLNEGQKKAASDFAASWQANDMEAVPNGLFDISPRAWDDAARRTELATVQSHLMTLGYTNAAKDGIMDPGTRAAIRNFQADHDLKVTGTVTPGLSESLTASRTR